MEFVNCNNKIDDCMIVALHNACLASGHKSTYKKVLNLSLKNKWYIPGQGFLCKYLDEAFCKLKLSVKIVKVKPRNIFYSIFNDNKSYLFIRPSDWKLDGMEMPGHAMVAVKCDTGVKVYNPYVCKTGWRTLHRAIKKGDSYIAIEVKKL